MSNDDLTQTSTATTTNNLIPVNIDREPIIFSDNDASLEGILYEVGRFYKRTGQFQMLFKHRAVSLSNGKLAVESLNSAYLLTGQLWFHRLIHRDYSTARVRGQGIGAQPLRRVSHSTASR